MVTIQKNAKPGCGTSFIQSSRRHIGAIINLSRMIIGRGRDTMKSPDYVAIGVLVALLVWAVADQFPRGKL